ncbi:aminoglycoside phosphotransferase [Pseudomonas alcaligenes]|uniref:Aminoglycoside phosphotransferase n=1 Tax=Aquipseudomonas alcaligenes TaxID=43263 RepID=A0ABR7RYF3_AQUAC|nr:phosphotransferase [Pseudomonas alcaligenes]MBC9249361.1 aminoglycoside phosphotransferase [Pseudomonas alcaligenes]
MNQALTPSSEVRAQQRAAFVARHWHAEATLQALPADASARRYFRLPGASLLLMDSPPAGEPLAPYLRVAELLHEQGLSAPRVLAADEQAGLALIEDFGQATYTRLLAAGQAEAPLYELAVDCLVALHRAPAEQAAVLPAYNDQRLADEFALFIDWYAPLLLGAAPSSALRTAYMALFDGLCDLVAGRREALVLRDFHVDNLMLLEERSGVAACGLLDFQDALHGACAYDLMSLLEDARRDLPRELQDNLLQRYLAQRPQLDREAFLADYAVLAAQRHAKVLGIFVRLAKRDGKLGYLAHLPRVLRLFREALERPALHPLRDFLDCHLEGWRDDLPVAVLDGLRGQSL